MEEFQRRASELAALKKAEDERAAAEAARKKAEDEKAAAEAARKKAEDERAAAEAARQTVVAPAPSPASVKQSGASSPDEPEANVAVASKTFASLPGVLLRQTTRVRRCLLQYCYT